MTDRGIDAVARAMPRSTADLLKTPDIRPMVVAAHPQGDNGVCLYRTRQIPGLYQNPPLREFRLMIAERDLGPVRADHGGVIDVRCGVGDMLVAPADSAHSYDIDRPGEFLISALPRSLVDEMCQEAGRPHLRDFGRAHTEIFRDEVITALHRGLWDEAVAGSPTGRLFADHAWRTVVALLLRRARPASPSVPARGGLPKRAMNLVLARMADDLLDEPTLSELAALTGLSVKHFARAFKQSTGLAPHHWLLRHRIERARVLLSDTQLSLTDVALACGYADQSHFGAAFRKATGVSPGQYRREQG